MKKKNVASLLLASALLALSAAASAASPKRFGLHDALTSGDKARGQPVCRPRSQSTSRVMSSAPSARTRVRQ